VQQNKQIITIHIKAFSIKNYLPNKLLNCIQTLHNKFIKYNKAFSIRNLIQGISVALQLKSATFLAEIMQKLLTSAG